MARVREEVTTATIKQWDMSGADPIEVPRFPGLEPLPPQFTDRESYEIFQDLVSKIGVEPTGYFVLVRTYVEPQSYVIKKDDGSEATLWKPDQVLDNAKYTSIAALVLKVGPLAYTSEHTGNKDKSVPWCAPGDWVLVPRQESFPLIAAMPDGTEFACQLVTDDKVIAKVEDPARVKLINQGARI